LPIDFENIEHEDGTEKPEGYVYIDNCIAWCRKYGLHIVLDLHKTCGYIFDDAEYSSGFFDNVELQDRFVALWERLAARYAKDSDIAMFEILNEITRLDVVDEWNQIALRCMKAIRVYAPDVKILFGGVGYSAVSAIKTLAAPIDENIVYNFHCYEPLIFTHQRAHWINDMPADLHIAYPDKLEVYQQKTHEIAGAMTGALADENFKFTTLGPEFFEFLFKDAVDTAERYNVALYCGEYGVIDQADPEDTVRWFKDIHDTFEKYGIGRAVWSYKKMDFGLSDEHYSSVREQLLQLL
jgi:aryl-phospho-beta-D-glucosidase BglC (GH1 family)